MKTETLLWLLGTVIVSIPVFLWISTIFKRSFAPVYGEEYQLIFFGIPVFTIKLADPNAKWFQKLPFYILAAPLNVASFMYEWVQEMTYEDYLEKKEIAKTKKDYAVSIVWQPKYKEGELTPAGIPKDKTVKILVSRKESLRSLKEIEGFTLASEFETEEGYRGWRIFTLFFEIKDLTKVISKFRQWQSAATLTFKGAFNAWSKGVSYKTLRKTTMNQLSVSLGRSEDEPFVKEINEKTIEFGYIVNSIKEGEIYLAAETMDMIELQEGPEKARLLLEAAKLEAETTKTEAQAEADSKVIKAKGEASAIKTVEDAKTKVIEDRTKIAIEAAKELNKLTVAELTAKYGTKGLSDMPGVLVESGDGSKTIDKQKLIEQIIALKIAS